RPIHGSYETVKDVRASIFHSLVKEGWTRHQENGPVPLIGAAGVVCSTSRSHLIDSREALCRCSAPCPARGDRARETAVRLPCRLRQRSPVSDRPLPIAAEEVSCSGVARGTS